MSVSEDELEIQGAPPDSTHYSSSIYFIGRKGFESPSHVLKLDDLAAYDPQSEFEGLEYAARLFERAHAHSNRLGVVHAIGYGCDPKFLVTRFQPGELLQPSFHAAVLRSADPGDLEIVRKQTALIALWISVFQQDGRRSVGGIDPQEYLAQVASMATRVAQRFRAGGIMTALVKSSQNYTEGLTEDEIERLKGSHPTRGDATPKNFIMGTDGVLYAFDMEGFGFSPLDRDSACLRIFLENDGVRTPAATRRASALWTLFFDRYVELGNSPTLVLMGYIHFLLYRMTKTSDRLSVQTWKRNIRDRFWIRDRLRWLSRLTGNLAIDVERMRLHL